MDKSIHIHVYSIPFPTLHRHIHIPEGGSLETIFRDMGFPSGVEPYLHVAMDGFPCGSEVWSKIHPKAGTHISVGVVPASEFVNDDANKGTLRTAASIAAIVGGYLIPGALGVSGIAAGILRSALMLGGVWAATTLIPLPPVNDTRSFQLTTARNQARQYAQIPKTYGRQRIFPPLAAKPITEIRGDDHYINLLFCLGYQPLEVDLTTMKIGEVPASNFVGFKYELSDGWTSNQEITLFSGDIDEQFMDTRVGHAAEWLTEGKLTDGVVLLTTPSNTARISLDFTFPDGIGRYVGESLLTDAIDVQIQYRPAGSVGESSWVSVIPNSYERVYFHEAENITRAQCVEWLVQLTALLGDVVDIAESFTKDQRNASEDLYKIIFNAAKDVNTASFRGGMTMIAGEEVARQNMTFQVQRVERLLKTVLEAQTAATEINPTFVQAFNAINSPLQMLKNTLTVRQQLRDIDKLPADSPFIARFMEYSQQLPQIFESWPTDSFEFKPTEARAGIVRNNVYWQVPEGKWEVRIRKTSPDYNDNNHLDECRLTVFRVHRTAPAISDRMRGRLALLAIEVMATDQVTGNLDLFSVEVESPLHYTTDGTNWLGPALKDGSGNNVSRNPAWIVADILTQKPNANPVAFTRLDGANLLEFATWCNDNDFHFDSTFEQNTTVHKTLQDVCRVAKASPTIRDGRYAVVHDKPQSIPRAFVTMTNANDFQAGKTLQKRAQALRIRFRNPARDWDIDELHVYDDGFGDDGRLVYHNEVVRAPSTDQLSLVSLFEDVRRILDINTQTYLDVNDYLITTNAAGTKTVIRPRVSPDDDFKEGANYSVIGFTKTRIPERIEDIDIPGLVDVPNDSTHPYHSNQVYKLGRYLLAAAKLRPETFKATMDFEHLTFERGDRVEVQMDTVLWGLGSSRIKSISRISGGPDDGKIESLTTEQDLFLTDGTKYAVRFRNDENTASGEATFIYDESEPDTITFETAFSDSIINLKVGDLCAWGEPSKTTISCIVQEIRHLRDMAAEITLIQYSPGVFYADTGAIPEFDPLISIPPNPERQRPPSPNIVKVTTDESVLERDTDGSLASRIVIDLRLPEGRTRAERDAASKVDAIHVQVRRSAPTGTQFPPQWIRSGTYAGDATRVSIREVEDGKHYDIRIRAVTNSGMPSDWSTLTDVLVIGKTSPPPDITNLRWDGWTLKWDYNAPPDHAGFKVRIHSGGGGGWASAWPAHDGLLLEPRFVVAPSYANQRRYHVKAVDTSGNESRNSISVSRADDNTEKSLRIQRFIATSSINFDAGTIAGSQDNLPFYKTRGGEQFYYATDDPFYHRTYEDYQFGPPATNWSEGANQRFYPGTRWVVQEYVEEGTQWHYEGKSPDQPLWPESLSEPYWPEYLSQSLWPSHMDWEEWGDGIPWHDGVDVNLRISIPYLHTQTKLDAFYLALLAPKIIEEVEDYSIVETSGDGDRVTLTKFFNVIRSVNVSVVGGGSAAYAKVGSKTWNRATYGDYYGPEIFLYDIDGNRTTGSVDVQVIGY